jgi:cob(I)alamin adenosyltransferase
VVYISKVYTKSGDKGETMLATGDMVSKDAQRIRTYGDVDELNSVIGLVRTELARDPKRASAQAFVDELDAQLGRIQQELFNLGAELATPGVTDDDEKLKVEPRHIDRIEQEIDAHNEDLEPLKSFILPGGGPTGAMCHLARTVCRRAEREVVALAKVEDVRTAAAIYVNRLSDYLFVIARAVAHRLGYDEVLWDPKST